MRTCFLALVLASAALVVLPALAADGTATASLPGAAETSSPDVDTSALQYYASRHETDRVEAEIRRLSRLYPGWVPPADPASLVSPDAPPDESALWELFKTGKLDQLQDEIAKRQAGNSGWKPSDDLAAKLALKLARTALVKASDAKDFSAVVRLAVQTPALLSASDLDVAWRQAEAFSHTGNSPRALDIAKMILGTVTDPAARLATVRKSIPLLDPPDLKILLAMGKTTPDGHSEFDPVALDLIRDRMGRILSGVDPGPMPEADLATLMAAARQPGSPAADVALLGWWFNARKDYASALPWFKLALAAMPDGAKATPDDLKIAEGTARALKELHRVAEAESLAWAWHDRLPSLGALYIESVAQDLTRTPPPVVDGIRLQHFCTLVQQARSADGAQALGWYAWNAGQVQAARAWFDRAMTWNPSDTTALGFALSLQKLNETDLLRDFVSRNVQQYPKLAALLKPQGKKPLPRQKAPAPAPAAEDGDAAAADPAPQDGASPAPAPQGAASVRAMADAAKRKDHVACLAIAEKIEASSGANAPERVQKGWCLMDAARPQEAAIAFDSALNDRAKGGEAAYGAALARIQTGQTSDALRIAASAPLTAARRNEIGVAVLAQRATEAFDAKNYTGALALLDQRRVYVPETRDVMLMRAWCLRHTGQTVEARAIFNQLDSQLSTAETRAGIAALTQ